MSKENPIRNTTAEVKTKDGGTARLVEAMAVGGPQSIENEEARGQQQLASQTTRLPTKGLFANEFGRDYSKEERREMWVSIGIIIGEPVEGDSIWTEVEMPEGWKIVATDHSMWSDLVDGKGRKRASIFYKAAFYDRNCHIVINRRYHLEDRRVDKDGDWRGPSYYSVIDTATEEELFRSASYTAEEVKEYKQENRFKSPHQEEARAWIEENFPLYEDPVAYWD